MPGDPFGEHTALAAALGALITDIETRTPGVSQGLAELVENAVHNVPGSQYAGITIASTKGDITTAAATHHYPVLLDHIQQHHRDGPCLSAAWQHHTVLIDDLSAEKRWPRYRRDALAQTPIRSILSFELFTGLDVMGALNFQADQPFAFDQEGIDIGMIYATHVAQAWRMMRRDEQFRSALASRDIIGQAKGMIMERYDVDAVQAFALLARLSKSSNVKVVDIAARLMEREHPRRVGAQDGL